MSLSSSSLHSPSCSTDEKSSAVRIYVNPGTAELRLHGEDSVDKYSSLLRQCGAARDLAQGKRLHVKITEGGLDKDRFLGNLLVQMYGKCGSLQEARTVFDGMLDKNCYSWTLLIGAYAQNGYQREALDLFWKMDREPDNVTFVTALCACSDCGTVAEGRAIHERIRCSRFEKDTVVCNSLISMYGKCECLVDARRVFEAMGWENRSVVSWNAMITVYAQSGHSIEALGLYWRLNVEGLRPDYVTFVSVLGASRTLAEGREIHSRVFYTGLDVYQSLANALVTMYGRFRSIEGARRLFEGLNRRDENSWNAIILTCAHGEDWRGALEFFSRMDVQKNSTTYINLLAAFTNPLLLQEGRKVYAEIVDKGFESDVVVATALVSMFGKCGSPYEAREVFNGMKKRDMVSWNVMIGSYIQNGMYLEALELYQRLDVEGFTRTKATFVSVLGACANLKALDQGKLVHGHVVERGLDREVTVATALVNMYAKCGSLEDVRKVFNGMHERDAVAWSTLISAFANNGYTQEALNLYEGMVKQNFKPDNVTFTSLLGACSRYEDTAWVHQQLVNYGYERDAMVGTTLLNSYGKQGRVEEARSVFDKLESRDTVSWNAMITCYVQNDCAKAAVELYKSMKVTCLKPDTVTFICVLEACSSVGRLAQVRAIHADISATEFESNVLVSNTLINMYARCGSLEDAKLLFNKAKGKTIVSWTAMVAAYAQHGYYDEALELFQQMDLEGIKPDEVTYTSIFFVCTHGGSLEQGWRYFLAMVEDHGLKPISDHYISMMDLLGRSGRLKDAKELLETMPYVPDPVAWMTFLNACRIHGNLELGEAAAERVYEVDPFCTAPYIAISNMYAALGRWDKVAEVRKAMEAKGLKKKPGLSFIEVGNQLHEFSSGEKFHPQVEEIKQELQRLLELMKAEGYVPDTKVVLHDVREEEKQRMVLLHSEKMAIAFGLLKSRGDTGPVRVVKNLRVCSDCHTATKLISKIVGREIIVRDCNRFHRFTPDGKCSCRDYW